MRRVLLVSPHFPPDSTAGTHRVRLLAPHLARYGWEPTVLTCAAEAYEGRTDPELAQLVPTSLRVVRCHALLGPILARKFGIPFVLDYQDPWVSAWGKTVGGGRNGSVDMKSRASRKLAEWLEPHAVRAANAITAVSSDTWAPILRRNPRIRPMTAVIPIGAEPRDFAASAGTVHRQNYFDPDDGLTHISYTGTILPLGNETLRAVLQGAGLLRRERPDIYQRLRLHFFGTSNQTTRTDHMRVLPVARELAVEDIVTELPTRLPYTEAVSIQRESTALLALGSTEVHYTASKIFPLLLARRPLLAVYHERSTVTDILRAVGRAPSISLLTYSDTERAERLSGQIAAHLIRIVERPAWNDEDLDMTRFGEFFAETLAGRLAGVFDRVVGTSAA